MQTVSKYIIVILLSIVAFVAATSAAYADGNCQPTYGAVYGGTNCPSVQFTINKQVQNPQNGQFVDNLGVNDTKFAPSQAVTFKITVTNTGNTTLDTVTVKDIFPQFVPFSGGAGSYDASSNTLTLDMKGLKPSESRSVTIGGKVVNADKLPTDKMVTCVTNQAKATVNGQTVSDTANLCIEKPQVTTKGGLPVMPPAQAKKTPATGPEMAFLFGLLPMGGFGYFLRKASQVGSRKTNR